MIVLDTNVVSELMRPKPSHAVVVWIGSRSTTSLFTTVVTEAEIRLGLATMPDGRRHAQLASPADELFARGFADRILPFDSSAASAYAQVVAERRAAGRPIDPFDAQIAAITRSRGARLATRNVKDFVDCGIGIIDPWSTP